jgi:ArsR family transcriptional regulator
MEFTMNETIDRLDAPTHYSLSEAEAARLESTLATIADRTRLRILSIALRAEDEPVCACKLVPELGLTQPTVSYHLKQLAQAGLLEREPRGAFTFYRLVPGALEQVAEFARALDEAAREGSIG